MFYVMWRLQDSILALGRNVVTAAYLRLEQEIDMENWGQPNSEIVGWPSDQRIWKM